MAILCLLSLITLFEWAFRVGVGGRVRKIKELAIPCLLIYPAFSWNTKRETDREGLRLIYADFFSNVAHMDVEYTDRTIDEELNSAAMLVRVKSG